MLCICLYQFVSLQFGNKKLIHIFVSLSKCSNFKFNVNVRERWYRFSSATIFLSLSRQSRKKKKEKNTGSCFFHLGYGKKEDDDIKHWKLQIQFQVSEWHWKAKRWFSVSFFYWTSLRVKLTTPFTLGVDVELNSKTIIF